MKEPPAPSAVQTSTLTKLKQSEDEITKKHGFFLINAEEELEIEIDSSECPEPLILELRTYSDLATECSIRGTCDDGDQSYRNDYKCWPTALECKETNGNLTCIDSWFYTYEDCVV